MNTEYALLRCSLPVITLLQSVFVTRSVEEELRDRFIVTLQAFETAAREAKYDAYTIEQAKYAWVALIDETLMRIDNVGRTKWAAHPLQRTLFGDHVAGEEFFRRLQGLYQGGSAQSAALEVYFVCLQLGFEGKYRLREQTALQTLKTSVWQQIQAGYSENRQMPVPQGEMCLAQPSLRVLYVGVLVFLLVVYGVYQIVNKVAAGDAVEAVRGDLFFTHNS